MKETKKNNSMTFEEGLQDPSLAHLHEALRYFQKTPASQMFPKKHELALTHAVERKAYKLFNENPNMSIKTVITTIFTTLTDDIPAPLALKLTQTIIKEWESMLAISLQKNEIVMTF